MDNPIIPEEQPPLEFHDMPVLEVHDKPLEVHLDKWLWAARFYKTLALARKAIQHGKIFYNGQRSRSSVEISIGGLLKIQHGHLDKLIIITGLSTRRRSMKEAAALYQDISQHQETLKQTISMSEPSMQPRHSRLRTPFSTQNAHHRSDYSHPQQQSPAAERQPLRPRKMIRFLRRPIQRPSTVNTKPIEVEVEVLD